MELFAIYVGLRQLHPNTEVTIHTDSQYCRHVLIHWAGRWEESGWYTELGEKIKNESLIRQIRVEMKRIGLDNINIIHVKRNTTPEMVWVDGCAKDSKRSLTWYTGPIPYQYEILSPEDAALRESIRSLKKRTRKLY